MPSLCKEQVIDTTLERAWDFIRTPANLNLITPADLNFSILTDLPEEMYDGLLIEYLVTIPFMGKSRWLTEIKHVRPRCSFVDEQRLGPYRFWYHYHEIQEVSGGVRFTDRITYEAPLGLIGKIADEFFIRNTLERIFDFRERKLAELLREPLP